MITFKAMGVQAFDFSTLMKFNLHTFCAKWKAWKSTISPPLQSLQTAAEKLIKISFQTNSIALMFKLGHHLLFFGCSFQYIFIGPEFDHCLPLSVTHWLTHCCLVNLIDVILACEDANSKLVDVVSVADDGCVGNNLLQIRKLRFVQKAKLLFRLWARGLV